MTRRTARLLLLGLVALLPAFAVQAESRRQEALNQSGDAVRVLDDMFNTKDGAPTSSCLPTCSRTPRPSRSSPA